MSTTINSSTSTATSTSTASPSCISVIPDKNGYVPEWACNAQYNYNPSMAAAIIFAVLFGSTLFAHIYQAFYFGKKKLCWTLVMGAWWETASFAIRVYGTKHQQDANIAFVSQILVLLAPMWINAFVYQCMGRMIYFFIPEQKIWGVKGIKVAKIFVWLDVASFITQVAGGIMIQPNSSPSTIQTGIHIYMGGIGLQEACIIVFTSIAIRFHLTMRQRTTSSSPRTLLHSARPDNWGLLLYALYAVLALITTRIIYRMVEFSSGLDPAKNPVPFHEAYFYALDGLPMWAACVILNICHPGRVLKGEGSEFPSLSRKEKKALKREKKEAKRYRQEEKRLEREERRVARKGGIELDDRSASEERSV